MDKPGKNNKQPIDPASKAQDENATGPIDPAAASRSVHNPPSPDSSQKTENGWQEALQRWKLPLEMAGIVFAIGYAIVTFLQWQDANSNFRISERASISTGTPQIDTFHRKITLGIVNGGHIPSGKVVIINHEAIEDGINPYAAPKPEAPIEALGHRDIVNSIPVGNPFWLTINIPGVIPERLASGTQRIVVAGVITFNDGFASDKEQTWLFCWATQYSSRTKENDWAPCDPHVLIPALSKIDGVK